MLMLNTHQNRRRKKQSPQPEPRLQPFSSRSKPQKPYPKRRRVIRIATSVSIVVNPYLNVPPLESQISHNLCM